jgi:hypothetical protein
MQFHKKIENNTKHTLAKWLIPVILRTQEGKSRMIDKNIWRPLTPQRKCEHGGMPLTSLL